MARRNEIIYNHKTLDFLRDLCAYEILEDFIPKYLHDVDIYLGICVLCGILFCIAIRADTWVCPYVFYSLRSTFY